MIKRIHHINFVVKDLKVAVARYQALLGADVIYEDLPQRGVRTARFRVGETWIVLVNPLDSAGVPGRFLEKNGEGFFLISYETDDLQAGADQVSLAGVEVLDSEPRVGLDDWRVMDLAPGDLFGVDTQLTETD